MKNKRFDESHVLHELKHYLPAQLALKDFVHHNSLHAFQGMDFYEGIFKASNIFGIQVTFNLNEYRKLYQQGRIKPAILSDVVIRRKGKEALSTYMHKLLDESYKHTPKAKIGQVRAFWKEAYQIDLDNMVQPTLFRVLCSYLDQGIALWHFPFGDKGLLNALRILEKNSMVSFFKSDRVKKLLVDESVTMTQLLKILVGKEEYFEQYIYDQQFGHKGWSGIVASIEGTPETLLAHKEIQLSDLIIVELLMEIDALDRHLGKKWQPLGEHITIPAKDYFEDIAVSEFEEVLSLWQDAFEWDYYDEVLSAVGHLNEKPRVADKTEKSFQAMFCIDDREDSIRRHIEYCDPKAETVGAPGFFGAAIYFQPFGGKFYEKNCPAPVTPKHLIKEIEVTTKHGHEIFHSKHSHTFFRGFMMSLSLGLWASFRMVLDLFRPKMRADIADAYGHMDINGKLLIEHTDPSQTENGLQIGYTVKEMADVVQSLLTNIGMIDNFAPIVYVVGHGSSSANNPHHGAYDCGACSGRPGGTNARVFAFMANHVKVREMLEHRNFHIPAETQFLGAMHNTSSDEIKYYDLDILSAANTAKHKVNIEKIEQALDLNAKERARRFASIDMRQDIKKIRQDIKNRAVSYFEPRPELGHGSNALCYVGAREHMKNLFLDRRAFHQSYDYRNDLNGDALAQVMAPLPVVCGGINLEYYFSRSDNEKMGAGTKLPHNVMGLIGVANSSDGDLRPGLHLQTVENHDPVRLLMMVEHRPEVILKVISASPAMYNWFDKSWVHLVAVSPEDGKLYYFKEGKFSIYEPLKTVQKTDNIHKLFETTKEMATNHILDATKENIPVHVYKN